MLFQRRSIHVNDCCYGYAIQVEQVIPDVCRLVRCDSISCCDSTSWPSCCSLHSASSTSLVLVRSRDLTRWCSTISTVSKSSTSNLTLGSSSGVVDAVGVHFGAAATQCSAATDIKMTTVMSFITSRLAKAYPVDIRGLVFNNY